MDVRNRKSVPAGLSEKLAILLPFLLLTFFLQAASIDLHVGKKITTCHTDKIEKKSEKSDFTKIRCQGTEYLSESGTPDIPWQVYTILLPPNADLETVVCFAENLAYQDPEITDVIEPAPPMATWDPQGNPIYIWPEGRTIVDGRDVDIYNTDAFWPAEAVKLTANGKLRQWNLAEVAIPLVRYNPVSGQLMELIRADIHVQFQKEKGKDQEKPLQAFKGRGRKRVKELVANFAAAAEDYDSQIDPGLLWDGPILAADGGYETLDASGYAIITTNWLYNNSILPSFKTHKENKGWTVHVITEDDYSGGTVLGGQDSWAAIRNWLRDNYVSYDLQYVFLVGKPHPDTGNIPMLMYDDDRDGDPAPTDYYYTNLTMTNDDVLNDTNHDKYWEVSVGRIPFYGNLTDLNHILLKTIDYENETDIDWRNHVLLPMVPLDDNTPAFQCGEQIKYNLLEPKGIESFRVYNETYGTWTPPEYLKSQKQGWQVWRDETIGLVCWETHGNQTSASGIINTSNVSSLNDNYPAATFQMSCQNAWPENSGNLAYSILKNGGITTIGGTRNLFYNPGRTDYTGQHTYLYASKVANGQSCGMAKDDVLMNGYEPTRKRTTLYGDPSVVVYPHLPTLTVTPCDAYEVNQAQGRAYTKRTYTLINNTDAVMNWTAEANVNWLNLSATSGTIPARGTAAVAVEVNTNAQALLIGNHSGLLQFTDTGTGRAAHRSFVLQIKTPGLLGQWKMDQTTGLTVTDNTGNGLDGVMVNMSEANRVTSFSGYALYFDGNDDFVRIEKDSNLNSDNMTITAWIKRDGTVANGGILFNRYYEDKYAGGLKLRDNKLAYHWNSDNNLFISNLTVPDNLWTPVALVIEPHQAVLYMMDASVQSAVKVLDHTPSPWEGEVGNNAFLIGRDKKDDRHFKGCIDDVRIYNYAATAEEIEAIWADGQPDVTPPAPDPMTWALAPAGHTQTSIKMTATTASDPSGVEYYFECTAGGGHDSGWQASPVYTDIGLLPDTLYTYRVKARDQSLNLNETGYSAEMSTNTLQEQWPYIGIFNLPCRIQAEDFDGGGQNYSYFDTTPDINAGYQYRLDEGVEIITSTDVDGDYAVMTSNGEWLEYTVAVPQAGYYAVDMRLSSILGGKTLNFVLDGQFIETVSVPGTGGVTAWETVTLDTLYMEAAPEGIMRVEFPIAGYYINWVEFRYLGNQQPYYGTAPMAPCKIEAEDYDIGGQDAAYHDETSGNSGLEYRQDDVDIQTSCDEGGGYSVWAGSGEWLEYTLGNAEGTFALDLRGSCAFAGKTVDVYLDDQPCGSVAVPYTGDPSLWKTATMNAVTLAGTENHILRLAFPQGGFNVNWIHLRAQTPCEVAQSQPGYVPLAGDFSGDCGVDLSDLEIIAESWLNPYDLDDFQQLAQDWLVFQPLN